MATPEFKYQEAFPLGPDSTKYRLIPDSQQYVSVANFDGQEVLKVSPEAPARTDPGESDPSTGAGFSSPGGGPITVPEPRRAITTEVRCGSLVENRKSPLASPARLGKNRTLTWRSPFAGTWNGGAGSTMA